MKVTAWRLVAAIAASCAAAGQTANTCVPTTPVAQQPRTKLKHRAPPAQSTPPTVTVQQMLQWKAPANAATSAAVRKSNLPIDPKEGQAFVLEGDLWRIEVEANDCDFHLEMTTPGSGPAADRVIVEIPQDKPFAAIRQAILNWLAAVGVEMGGPVLRHPIRVHVTGFAFYDASHFSNSDPQRGHDHGTALVGTLWELHPVWSVSF
jgi:hypothetical protein